jgi:hypothetical protein
MKKIIFIFTLVISSFILVSCKENAVPKVQEKYKVELTSAEVKERFNKVDATNNTAQMKINLNATGKQEGKPVLMEAKVDAKINTNSDILGKMELNLDVEGVKAKGKTDIYLVNSEERIYLNADLKVDINMGPMNNSTTIKGKYYQDMDFGIGGITPDITTNIDLSEVLLDEKLINFLSEYTGATYYLNGDDFRVKIDFNNALYLENKALIESLFGTLTVDMEQIAAIDFSLVMVIIDNNFEEIGVSVSANMVDGENNMKLKLDANLKFGVKVEALPDFKDYKPFENGLFPF